MAGVKGRSGTNRGKDKPWQEALRLAAFREGADGRKRLMSIAEACVSAAEQGDMQAIKEIGDRLDGKPIQESTVTLDDKRDASDWSRNELVAFLNECRAGGAGAATANRGSREPDSVH
jgi:hypothetical protein